MCYTIIILYLLCSTGLAGPLFSDASAPIRIPAIRTETGLIRTGGARHPGLLAQRAQTTIPERKEPASGKQQDAASQTTEQTREAAEQKDKKSSPKNFVPSEKIDADKAVDFPADI